MWDDEGSGSDTKWFNQNNFSMFISKFSSKPFFFFFKKKDIQNRFNSERQRFWNAALRSPEGPAVIW